MSVDRSYWLNENLTAQIKEEYGPYREAHSNLGSELADIQTFKHLFQNILFYVREVGADINPSPEPAFVEIARYFHSQSPDHFAKWIFDMTYQNKIMGRLATPAQELIQTARSLKLYPLTTQPKPILGKRLTYSLERAGKDHSYLNLEHEAMSNLRWDLAGRLEDKGKVLPSEFLQEAQEVVDQPPFRSDQRRGLLRYHLPLIARAGTPINFAAHVLDIIAPPQTA